MIGSRSHRGSTSNCVRMRIVLAAMLVSVFAAGARGAGADNPVLIGDVGANDSFAISLVDGSGVEVKHLEAGTYTLLVHDRSVHHNFHLTGPGVNVATDLVGIGD